jgi:HAD superfamily hydrolase (TIGR01509 family)
VLFDLDGTLVDSSPLHDEAFRSVIAERRPAWLVSFRYEDVKGMTTVDAFRALGEHDTAALRDLVDAKRDAFRRLAAERGLRAFPGAAALLVALARRHIAVYVVTSAGRVSATTALRRAGLGPLVRGIVAAEDVARGKPAPDPYRAVLRRFRLRASDGVVVEDAESGLTAARAAGLRAIRVHGRFDPREHDAWASDLTALRARLARTSLPPPACRDTVSSWLPSSSRSCRQRVVARASVSTCPRSSPSCGRASACGTCCSRASRR